jgi:pyruvate,water dikinase
MNKQENLILSGTAASGGQAQGKVKIVTSIKDGPSFEEGSVLVTRITDPSMVMMMAKAAAIVCDIGGLTSHPSIVSREMGIPCVVNTKNATTVLKDGQEVIVDGTAGKIYHV